MSHPVNTIRITMDSWGHPDDIGKKDLRNGPTWVIESIFSNGVLTIDDLRERTKGFLKSLSDEIDKKMNK